LSAVRGVFSETDWRVTRLMLFYKRVIRTDKNREQAKERRAKTDKALAEFRAL